MSGHFTKASMVLAAGAIAFGGLSLIAQTPAPGIPAGAQVGQVPAPAAAGQTPAGQPAGRGAPGGRGGQGGPGKDDPINADVDYSKKPPALPKTPADELKQFILQPGYRLELVLADPDIQDPTAMAFDGNGRLFVLEERGYMNDADATGELDPVGRISLHVDTDGDGVYDKHTVFVDHLIFPRFLTPFGPNAILTKESNADEVWKFTDTNGDGIADKKELFDTGYGRTGNVEHQESFFTWAMDNWMYSTYNAFRARWTPNGVIKETTGANGAAWGVTQDNDGKQWFQGGASGLPSYWQFPIVYGNFGGGRGSSTMDPDLAIPWGAPIRIADMQGGMAVIRMPDGSLKSTTAGAGGNIFRGDRLPKDLIGDYFYGEQVARIVRRVRPENQEGLTVIRNAYPNNEFLKSLDPYFRPVDQATAPDGTMYILDMYHGIIQESQWTPRGSYLRAKIEQYDLDKVIHKGRIWRLVYDGVKRDRSDALDRDKTVPRMNTETAAQLVTHLSHPNGWWRDTAQQLLVLKQDKSVVPALQTIVKTSPNLLGRFHALWTLEGLGALDAALARQLMEDREPRMRIQAIRASETLYKAGDKSFAADYKRLTTDSNVDVVVQSMLTMNRWKVPEATTTIKAVADANKAKGVQTVASAVLNPGAAAGGRGGGGGGAAPRVLTPEQQSQLERGGQIYSELCFSCHGTDGYGTPRPESNSTMGPPLAGSPRVNGHRDYAVNVVLHGLTGPVGDKSYTEVMIPMDQNKDEWIAAVTSYVRNSFGNTGPFVTAADVARVRAATTSRKAPWTIDELTKSLPAPIVNNGWKVTASHNDASASGALSLTSWNTGAPQEAGMWIQVELVQPASVSEIQFESSASGGRGGGGGRAAAAGRGGRAGAAGPAGAPAAADPAAAAAAADAAQAAAPAPIDPATLGYPRGYKVEVSADGASWRQVAEGKGDGATTVITFAPAQAKFVRITETAAVPNGPAWSIRNLRVLAAGK
jgi:mono/diheme cytochrome c family protein